MINFVFINTGLKIGEIMKKLNKKSIKSFINMNLLMISIIYAGGTSAQTKMEEVQSNDKKCNGHHLLKCGAQIQSTQQGVNNHKCGIQENGLIAKCVQLDIQPRNQCGQEGVKCVDPSLLNITTEDKKMKP